MLHVYYKQHLGDIVYKQKKDNQQWTLGMYNANALCALVYRYTKKNLETNKNEIWSNLFAFFGDTKHLERCLKSDLRFENLPHGEHRVVKIRLYYCTGKSKYLNKNILNIAKILIKYNYRVEISQKDY